MAYYIPRRVALLALGLLLLCPAVAACAKPYLTSGLTAATGKTPANLTRPALSGNPVFSQLLTTTNGTWNFTPVSYSYAWQRCNQALSSCSIIAGAAAKSYLISSADLTLRLRSLVKAKSSSGKIISATSLATVAVSASPPPVIQAAPALVSSSITAAQTLSGTVPWSLSTSGDVASVEYWMDGTKLASISGQSPFTFSFNTLNYTNASHTLGVALVSSSGVRVTPQIGSVTISNSSPSPAFSASITSPAQGVTVSGIVPVTVSTSQTPSRVDYYLDGILTYTSTSAPYTFNLNSATLSNASHTIKACAVSATLVTSCPQIAVTIANYVAPPSGTVLWNGDFETGNFSQYSDVTQGYHNQIVSGNQTALGGPAGARQGTYYYSSEVLSGEVLNGGERCEIIKGGTGNDNGVEQYYGWSLFLPYNYPGGDPADGGTLLGQFHSNGFTSLMTQANIQIATAPNFAGVNYNYSYSSPGVILGVNGGDPSQAGQWYNINTLTGGLQGDPYTSTAWDLGSLASFEGGWSDWVMHIIWSDHGTGTFELSLRKPGQSSYSKVISMNGNISNIYKGFSSYLKLGQNRHMNSTLPPGRDWFDGVKLGSSFSAVAP